MSDILTGSKLIAFVPTMDLARARRFYEEVLGLRVAVEIPGLALEVDANGTMLRVTLVRELKAQPFTVLGWQVESIEETVRALSGAGILFESYAGMNDHHPLKIWQSPAGARVAWFKDPDGNLLSVTQF